MALNSGDIAIIGASFDNPDDFSFLTLVDIPGGEMINFSDTGWLASGTFSSIEGTATWVAPAAGVPAGTVVNYQTNIAEFTATGLGLSVSGDQIIAFQGSKLSPTLLYAYHSNGPDWDADSTGTNSSALPTGLVPGLTAIAIPEVDNATYNEVVTTGDKATLLAAIGDPANWITSDFVGLELADGPFTVTPAPPGITTSGDIALSEADGVADTATFVLNTPPGADVIISLAVTDGQTEISTDGGASYGASATLVLTAAGPVGEVLVRALDDTIIEGSPHGGLVEITGVSSADPDYDGLTIAPLPVSIIDNDVNITRIHDVQGPGDASPLEGETVTIEAVVVGDFQDGDAMTTRQLGGFFLQEEDADADGDAATSEGIFVFADGFGPDVSIGDTVRVTGTVEEFFGETQIAAPTEILITGSGQPLPSAATISLPSVGVINLGNGDYVADLEAYEGMRVSVAETLTITEMFNLDRFGEIRLSEGGRLTQFTQNNAPDMAGFDAHQQDIAARSILYDDGLGVQNAPIGGLDGFGPVFGTNTDIRMGDTISDLSGVLTYGLDEWRVRAAVDGENSFDKVNTRPASPEDVGGDLKIVSLNVLNFFTTLDTFPGNEGVGPNGLSPRGADTNPQSPAGTPGPTDEYDRQLEKLTTALVAMDADVVALVELENDFLSGAGSTAPLSGQAPRDVAPAALVASLNAALGAPIYDWVDPGQEFVGGDAIAVGYIYDTTSVTLTGAATVIDDAAFLDPNATGEGQNRAALVQSFEETASGEDFTLIVNHFKSKGSAPATGVDADQGDGAGAWNDTRTKAAEFLDTWVAANVAMDEEVFILGDLNAYASETPITTLEAAGYTDLAEAFIGPDAYSFVFDGQSGTLDYAMANAAGLAAVTGVTEWHVNADEPDAIDYNLDFGRDPAIFDGSVPWRHSDHDPVIFGLSLANPPAPYTLFSDGTFDTELSGHESLQAALDAAADGQGIRANPGQSGQSTGSALVANEALTVRTAPGSNVTYFLEPDVIDLSLEGITTSSIIGNVLGNRIDGDDGDNTLAPREGADTVFGNGGNDRMFLSDGDDEADGGAGNDAIFGDGGNDSLLGGDGDDRVFGGNDQDTLRAGQGDDTANGNSGDDILYGEAGDDKGYGGPGDDLISGGDGNDALFGDSGMDTIEGNAGNDRIFGGPDNDSLLGGTGQDTLGGGVGDDYLEGGTGKSFFYGDGGNDTIVGNADIDVATGGSGDDLITSFGGNDRLVAGGGNDTLDGGAGNDQLNGGAGNDMITAGLDQDRLIGGAGADMLNAGSGNDTLFGGSGNDTLDGGDGVDRLDAGAGSDNLTGGMGSDTFIFSHQGANSNGDMDVVTDLDFAEDLMIIRAFAGNPQVVINSAAELYGLDFVGLTVEATDGDTLVTFDEGDGNSHSVVLMGLSDPSAIA